MRPGLKKIHFPPREVVTILRFEVEVAITELDAKYVNAKKTCEEVFVGERLQADYTSYMGNLEETHRKFKDVLAGVTAKIKGLEPGIQRAANTAALRETQQEIKAEKTKMRCAHSTAWTKLLQALGRAKAGAQRSKGKGTR